MAVRWDCRLATIRAGSKFDVVLPATGQGDTVPPGDTGPEGGAVPGGAPQDGRPAGRRRPRRAVIIAVAACAAIVAAIIVVDATTHRGGPAASQPPAPALALPSLSNPGQQVSLSDYRGQPVIVNFFASWCAPCKKETPLLAGYYRSAHGSVVIIGVDTDDSAPAARQFVAAEGVTYPVGFESTSAQADAYGVSAIGIPETFFLSSGHRIVKRVLGGVTMKDLTAGTAMIEPARNKGRS
jgi:thiol-disulfide isomerase/thioredoxin